MPYIRYAPPAARRIVKGMCVMLGLEPSVKHDERIQRYRYKDPSKKAQQAKKKKEKKNAANKKKKKKVMTRRDVYQRRGARRDNDDNTSDDNDESDDGLNDSGGDEEEDNEGTLEREDGNDNKEVECDDFGTSIDWWAAGLSFLSRKNCLAELRYDVTY